MGTDDTDAFRSSSDESDTLAERFTCSDGADRVQAGQLVVYLAGDTCNHVSRGLNGLPHGNPNGASDLCKGANEQ